MMAISFVCTRSLIFAEKSLNSSVIRRFPSPRSFITSGNRSYSRFQQRSLLSRLRGGQQNSENTRFKSSSAAGIVRSDFTVEIPEISLFDFVLSKFSEYGDDVAMVSNRDGKHRRTNIYVHRCNKLRDSHKLTRLFVCSRTSLLIRRTGMNLFKHQIVKKSCFLKAIGHTFLYQEAL